MKRKITLLAALAFSISVSHAQSSAHKVRVNPMFGLPSLSHSAIPQSEGGIVTLMSYPLTLAKLDSNYKQVWSKGIFGSLLPLDEGVGLNMQLLQPAGGGYFTSGTHIDYNTGQSFSIDFLKFGPNGEDRWMKSYRVANIAITDAAEHLSMAQSITPAQGYMVGLALGLDNVPDHKDPILMCTDSTGNLLWAKQYAFTGQDEVLGIHFLPSGNSLIHIHNTVNGTNGDVYSTIIMNVDPTGNPLWSKQISASGTDYLRFYTGTMLGTEELYLGGNLSAANWVPTTPDEAVVLKMDTTGSLIWTNKYNTGMLHNGFLTSGKQNDSVLVFTGAFSNDVTAVQSHDVFMTAIRENGTVAQANGYTFPGRELITSQYLSASGHWMFGGLANWNTPDTFSAYYLKPDYNGAVGCNIDTLLSVSVMSYTATAASITTTAMALSPSADTVMNLVFAPVFQDVMICAGTLDVSTPASVPSERVVFPNPAKDIVRFSGNEPVNVVVYSVEGKLLINEKAVKQISVSNLPAGNYFIRLTNAKGALVQSSFLSVIK